MNNKKQKDDFSQNFDLTLMKKYAPKLPELLNYKQNLDYKKDRSNILNIFFGHLKIKEKINKKYIKTCLTQRTKQKLLTYVYYKPLHF